MFSGVRHGKMISENPRAEEEIMNFLEDYYNAYNEEGRLLSRHGQVEYLTTM